MIRLRSTQPSPGVYFKSIFVTAPESVCLVVVTETKKGEHGNVWMHLWPLQLHLLMESVTRLCSPQSLLTQRQPATDYIKPIQEKIRTLVKSAPRTVAYSCPSYP